MPERVFIVDEDIHIRDFLYKLISEVGFGVLTFPAGAQLLERLKKERPVLIIIEDIPGEESGCLLARKIRDFDKEVKIIMLGVCPQPGLLAAQLRESEISAYLKKDFSDSEVIKNILSVLKEDAAVQSGPKKQGRVLIVDDEIEVIEMAGNYLRRRGFDVEVASSGEECLEILKVRHVDIVLLDITMSGMDGVLTLKHIRDLDPRIKVVMATALGGRDLLAQTKAMGASSYIVKPFNLETLESLVAALTKT